MLSFYGPGPSFRWVTFYVEFFRFYPKFARGTVEPKGRTRGPSSVGRLAPNRGRRGVIAVQRVALNARFNRASCFWFIGEQRATRVPRDVCDFYKSPALDRYFIAVIIPQIYVLREASFTAKAAGSTFPTVKTTPKFCLGPKKKEENNFKKW